jgi:outer membrane receptor protein involved in Fe transport
MVSKPRLLVLFAVLLTISAALAQETTGGLQGTVKDPAGAVIPKAQVEVTGSTLVGAKKITTDQRGYYRFANLPPGVYSITVKAQGFSALKQNGIDIAVGHLPTLDLELKVGGSETTVEVSSEAPVIDVTTTRTLTNITEDVIDDVPHGRSFQSVIQFAPSARNEPLAGATPNGGGTGTGGTSPGSGTSGNTSGYSVAGGADSENAYLVEGQETANIIGGYSHTQVPFEFISEVQVKSSGIEAEHGGSLGGVVNVVMNKGGNHWHGNIGTTYESDGLDGSPNARLRLDVDSQGDAANRMDRSAILYQRKKDHFKIAQPDFTIGGPIRQDRLWFYLGFAPEFQSTVRKVNWGPEYGVQSFNQDTQTYYLNGRLDAAVTQNIRLFASWLNNYQRQSGSDMPWAESVQGYTNPDVSSPIAAFTHGIGYSSPSATYNFGADITITPQLVATTRFGYHFENYHDFGYPTSGQAFSYRNTTTANTLTIDNTPIPASLVGFKAGQFSTAYNDRYTYKNVMKHRQFDQDIAWFKSGWLGTHNIKFGYQLNNLYNDISQPGNLPFVRIYVGKDYKYAASSLAGEANCQSAYFYDPVKDNCTGQYGMVRVQDYGTLGKASNYNHGFFAQDAWTIAKGLTLNLGVRVEKESLPSYPDSNLVANPINFGWGDKIAPRIGAAWDVFQNGKTKVFGSYGVFNDTMKLNLAISSFGGQYYRFCNYLLNTSDLSTIDAVFKNFRACPAGNETTQGNFASGSTPAGLQSIENLDYRNPSAVVPGIKPYRQHESVFGVAQQLTGNLALEVRWDRRRLDHAIEDGSIVDPVSGSETFVNMNPGEGVTSTFNGFSQFLYGANGPTCDDCGMIKPARSYDGVEVRLTRSATHGWAGMFSYTYSRLRGNYSGLTSTDITDGFGGRNSPNNSRAFDEPYFQYDAYGRSSSGRLNTDRPNTFKGYAYYQLPWKSHRNSTSIGLFQTAYQGTPRSTFLDVGYWDTDQPSSPVYPEGRGKYVDAIRNADGSISINSVGEKRTPWFIQSDLNLSHTIKVNKANEAQTLTFEMVVTNLFNQHSVTSYYDGLDSLTFDSGIYPGGLKYTDAGGYQAYMHAYDWKSLLNTDGVTLNNMYGKPYTFQQSRSIRFGVHFKF